MDTKSLYLDWKYCLRVLSQFNEIELMEGPRREFPKSAKRDWQETYGPIVSKKVTCVWKVSLGAI